MKTQAGLFGGRPFCLRETIDHLSLPAGDEYLLGVDPFTTSNTLAMKILFLCTGNSCRSQMAEGWARALHSDSLQAYSAGIEKHGLNPYAVRAMGEAGVDIKGQSSKTVADIEANEGPVEFDVVVTVCGHADENCPMFAGSARVVHVPFDDPPKLAADIDEEEE